MLFRILILVFSLNAIGLGQPVQVGETNRFLQTGDGKPFFWLGDTAWELFHTLNREEALRFLRNRSEKGFNVIQAVALYELESFERPNAYGDFPLTGENIVQPDTTPGNHPADKIAYDYWDHVAWIIQQAADNGLIMGLLPCWGEYVTPRFRSRTIDSIEKGYRFGWFIGNRFKNLNEHIIWILGGDRLPDERENGVAVWRAMAEGITDAVNGEHTFDNQADYTHTFMTYHCYRSSSTWFHADPWIDMHTWGSYHAMHDNERAYFVAHEDWNLKNPKPTLNSEPAYELSPVNYKWEKAEEGYFDDFDVRQVAYWSVFSGACGHTYGCDPIWQMYKSENQHLPQTKTTKMEWYAALDAPGAFQMNYLKNLILSRPFWGRMPNQPLIAENPYDPVGYLTATSGDGFALVYIPTGKPVIINTGLIPASKLKFWWYNPGNGKATFLAEKDNQERMNFDPPGEMKRGNDWVLVIDDASRPFPEPGTPVF